MKIACENAESLIPSYLDGELSEEQAAPLRRHLLDCSTCREGAQDDQALKRWFAKDVEAITAPPDFASRVARRAFAGDTGVLEVRAPAGAPEGRLLRFVVGLTAVAAGLLLTLALAIRAQELPESTDLQAEESYPAMLDELEKLNQEEAALEAEASAEPVEDRE